MRNKHGADDTLREKGPTNTSASFRCWRQEVSYGKIYWPEHRSAPVLTSIHGSGHSPDGRAYGGGSAASDTSALHPRPVDLAGADGRALGVPARGPSRRYGSALLPDPRGRWRPSLRGFLRRLGPHARADRRLPVLLPLGGSGRRARFPHHPGGHSAVASPDDRNH